MFGPLTLETDQRMLRLLWSKYYRTSEEDINRLYNHQQTIVSMPLTSLIWKICFEINQDQGREDDIYELSAKDACIVTEFLKKCRNAAKAIRDP